MDGWGKRNARVWTAVITIVGAFVLATIGFGLASASPGNGVHQRLKTIEPYDQQTASSVDLGDPGLSQGDLATFHGEIYSADGTVDLGYEDAECVVGSVDGPTFEFNCSDYFVLRGGQITMEGTLELPAAGGLRAMRSMGSRGDLQYHFAITGGTDRYESVGGQLDWGGDDPDALILVFDLTR
jgi:hypothetical protein